MKQYDFKVLEPSILDFWKDNKIYETASERGKKLFYYLDGPPYTTGSIHIGHAWGKALRDSVLRYKRMTGFKVWDQPGFDMHGLPIEVSVEKELGIKDKKEILNKIGLKKFIEECQKYALSKLWPMVDDFKRMGVWMNWENPYMTIKNEYIEGAWFALAQAHMKGLLYLGKKSMTWCPRCATALAKHELEYSNRSDDSIFVKFPIRGKENEYLIIWTTTPWTIPFNMAVMVHPEYNYVKAKVGDEIWIVAEALAGAFISGVADKEFTVIETVKGEQLKGIKYEHPFMDEVKFHQEHKDDAHVQEVILSDKYVTTDSGTGLVHCAPGCGPEDFEVGKEHGIPPFNEADEHGCFGEAMGPLAGLIAKTDDHQFIQLIEDKGLLVAKTKVEHEYAHCWRCKSPIIFRATDQWFLAVEKLKDDMVKRNEKVYWVPDWAGQKWFDNWLKSLQDWCISRQRFWGIPLPIWVCECKEIKVIATRAELKSLTGKELENLHRPWIDEVTLKCSCGKDMHRIPDVLDVWLDSGVAPWATLNYPSDKKTFIDMGFPELILEGKDQIRGWFNSLMCMSMVSFGKVPYKAVYMHGFINDSQGRKMSKSLKNTISPYEIIDQFGADTLRYYQIGGAQPGVDLNFNHDDAKIKAKNLGVLWNVHNFTIELAKELDVNPEQLNAQDMTKQFGVEEQFMLSKLNSTIKTVTEMFEKYRLNEIPAAIDDLFLTLSRTYIQMVRDKASIGPEEQRKAVLFTLYATLKQTLKMLAPLAPFITEQMWLNLKEEFALEEQSIHLCSWPKQKPEYIDEKLEENMTIISTVIQNILAAREKAKLSVRWPVKKVDVVAESDDILRAIETMSDIAKTQTNVKEIHAHRSLPEIETSIKPNAGTIGKAFGPKAPDIMKALSQESEKVITELAKGSTFKLNVNGESVELNKDHVIIERKVPEHLTEVEFKQGFVYLDTTRTPELDAEGFAREVMRRIQQLRKESELQKADKAKVFIEVDESLEKDLQPWKEKMEEKCGAEVQIGHIGPTKPMHKAEEKVKGRAFTVYLEKQ